MDKKKVIDDYKEVIGALQSCEKDCSECDELSECLHWIRQILVVVLKYIVDSIQYDFTNAVKQGFEQAIDEHSKKDPEIDKDSTRFYS